MYIEVYFDELLEKRVDDQYIPVYFSPLAKIPGPKIAGRLLLNMFISGQDSPLFLVGFTMLYQGYYDVWQRGQYIWRIQEMHEEYGQ